jgi:hypothetical protein
VKSLDGITVSSATNSSVVCLNATQNQSTAAGTAAANGQFDAVGLSVVQTAPSSTFHIQGYSGPANDGGGQVETFLNGQNTLAGPGGGSIAVIQNGNALGFTAPPNGPNGPTSCPTAP